MEQFKTTLKRRLYAMTGYAVALAVLVCLGLFRPMGGNNEETQVFMAGFNAGLFAVAIGVLVVSAVKYRAALKNEGKLKALYITEHDERLLAIHTKIGGTGMQVILFGLLGATIAAGFLNQTVFFTLLGALLFGAAVKAVLKVYYTRRAS